MEQVGRQTESPRAKGTTKVVVFGMRCAFTQPTLTALAAAQGVEIAGVILPEDADSRAREADDPIRNITEECAAQLIDVPDRSALSDTTLRTTLEQMAPDVIVVACFPWRLPKWLLDLPPRGCINVHPSLLPDGRGPEPVYWAFRWGLEETGVTLHLMDEEIDAGPIVAQYRVPIPEGSTTVSLESTLARIGATMVIEHISTPADRPVIPASQNNAGARYARTPRPDDLVVPTSWSALHAARFIHAVAPTYGPVPVLVLSTGQRLAVSGMVMIEDHEMSSDSVMLEGSTAHIRFVGGMLTCQLFRQPQPLVLRRLTVRM